MEGLARTTAGVVRARPSGRSPGVWEFLGVPYAAAPVGDLRWRPPEPPGPWTGVRDCVAFGPIAPQPPPNPVASLPGDPTDWAEDCLTLNVWTPGVDDRRRPVMVWIHGGSFFGGSGASTLYRGDHLAAARDVVVVTCNYRLGALGFLGLPLLADPAQGAGGAAGLGNWGLLDQIAVLRFVAESIGEFGGDPGNVTVFGESAGALSIGALMAAPAAQGLFHRAVLQSGPPATMSTGFAAARAERFCALAGLATASRAELVALDAEALVEATVALAGEIAHEANPLPFLPVLDDDLLVRHPQQAIETGTAAPVPLLVGTNRDEMSFFLVGDTTARHMDLAEVVRRTAVHVGAEAAPVVVDAYREARVARGEDVSPIALWNAVGTDLVFRLPSLAFADASWRAERPTFSYLFDWVCPMFDGALGACHALEVPFVFGTAAEPEVASLAGAGPKADVLREAMMAAWVAFARHGDPSCDELGEWPAYDPRRRPTMMLGPTPGVADDPRGDERRACAEAGAVLEHSHGLD